MASIILRASPAMRSFLVTGPHRTILPISASFVNITSRQPHRQQQHLPFGCRSQSTDKVPNFKWDVAGADVAGAVSSKPPELIGAIMPMAAMNTANMVLLPFTFSIMYYMDFLLNYMPWCTAIIATTVTVKLITLPLVIKQNRHATIIHNLLPKTQKIQIKMNDAMCAGDAYTRHVNQTKLSMLYEEHGVSVKKRLLPLLAPAPVYAAVFFYLRAISELSPESLVTGGVSWFTNLTLPDPFYIIPAATSASMLLLMELGDFGAKGGPAATLTPMVRWAFRGMPLVFFLYFQSCPTAVLIFWMTNNLVSLLYALTLKQNWVRNKLNLPTRIIHDPSSLPLTNQSLTGQFSKTIDRGRAGAERTTIDIRRLDDIAFRKAATAPLKKTYKTPPVKD